MHRILKSIIFLTIAFLMLFYSCAYAETVSSVSVESAPLVTQQATLDGMVRVYLSSLGSPSSLTLTISGSYSLSDGTSLSSGQTLVVSFNSSTGALTLKRNGTNYSMGSSFTLRRHSTTGSNGVKIAQARKPGNLYPGDIEFKAVSLSGGGYKLYTIAHIYLENYLYGVVPYEMGSSAPLEALKAQAVAARTYTVRMMSVRSSSLYDVVDSTGDQTYNGTPTSVSNCNTAVDRTKGIVIKNGSSYTATYYSSSNGGQTEAIKNAWGSSGYSYLGVKDDPFDFANPDSVVKQATLYADASNSNNNTSLMALLRSKAVSVLNAAGYNATSDNTTIRTIKSIIPHTPKYASPSRLYTKMDFTMSLTTYNMSNVYVTVTTTVTCDIFNDLESLLGMSIQTGQNELWSVAGYDSYFKIQARRYGHGIGMSQRGAMYMGQLGFTYDEILGFYYPGSTRVGCTFTNTILSANSSEMIVTDEDPAEIDGGAGVRGIVSLSAGEQLAIRSTKSNSASVLTVLSNGTPVTVLANYGSWCKISYGSIIGYVPTNALNITGTAPQSDDNAVSSIDGFAVVKSSSYLNLRQSGSYSASILSTAPNGAILTVLSWSSDWAYIQYGKLVAYAAADFLTFSAEYPEEVQESDNGAAANIEDSDNAETLSAIVATESGSLNMRQLPKAGSKVLIAIPQNTVVSVTNVENMWSGVSYFGLDGYVMTMFLSFDDDISAQDTEQTVDLYAKVTTESGSLNLRQQPKAGSPIYCTIPYNEIVPVLSKNSEWCQVTYNGMTGYAMTAFLTFLDGSEDSSDTGDATQDSDAEDTGDTSGEDTNQSNEGDTKDNPQDGTATAMVTTASGSLNLRADALPGSRVLAGIPQGETIPVIQRLNTWTYTHYQEYYGYVMNAYLTFSSENGEPSENSDSISAVVITASGSLNLRDEPYGNVLMTIPQYATVDVYTRGSAWCHLKYEGVYGYVMTAYLSFDGSDIQQNNAGDTNGSDAAEQNTNPNADSATITVDAGSLNLRAAKSATASVLTTIPNGTVVELLTQAYDWCKVVYGAYQGYVQTQFLTLNTSAEATVTPDLTATPEPTATPAPTEEPYSVIAWINTPEGSLNLRDTPNGNVLTTVPQYAQVEVLSDIESTWCKTRYEGIIGYVVSEFLTTTEPSAQPEPTATPEATVEANSVTAWVNTPEGSLNLRSVPSGNVLTTIPQYAQVEVLSDIHSAWCKTKYGTIIGYTVSEFLTTTEPAAGPEVTETPEATGEADFIQAWVNTPSGSLNLRNVPNGNVLTTIPQFAQVMVFSDILSTWCKAQYDGITGYTVSKYLTTVKPNQTPGPTETPATTGDSYSVTAWVNTPSGSLNLRSEPHGDVLTAIPQYAQVAVLSDIHSTWCKTQYGSITGYTVSEYLSTSKPSQEPEATNAPVSGTTGSSNDKPMDPTLHDPGREIVVYVRPPAGASALAMYDACSENSNLLQNMNEDSEVEIIRAGEIWCEVVYSNRQGYCLRDGLSFFED